MNFSNRNYRLIDSSYPIKERSLLASIFSNFLIIHSSSIKLSAELNIQLTRIKIILFPNSQTFEKIVLFDLYKFLFFEYCKKWH